MTETVNIQGLPFAPPQGSLSRIEVRAFYFEGQIDLKRFRTQHPHHAVLALDPLVLEPARGSFVALTKFGAAVLWNCPEALRATVIQEVDVATRVGRGEEEDTMSVVVGQRDNTVTFDEVGLRELTLDKLKIISLALGQSVALDRIERDVALAIGRFEPVVAELGTQGRLLLKKREVLQAVGFALRVRQAVLANLTLFDKPPETWESEALERLDAQLYDFFDLEERVSAINQKLDYFSEVNGTLMNLLNHGKTVRLEWIIIVLIFIELVVFVAMEIRARM